MKQYRKNVGLILALLLGMTTAQVSNGQTLANGEEGIQITQDANSAYKFEYCIGGAACLPIGNRSYTLAELQSAEARQIGITVVKEVADMAGIVVAGTVAGYGAYLIISSALDAFSLNLIAALPYKMRDNAMQVTGMGVSMVGAAELVEHSEMNPMNDVDVARILDVTSNKKFRLGPKRLRRAADKLDEILKALPPIAKN